MIQLEQKKITFHLKALRLRCMNIRRQEEKQRQKKNGTEKCFKISQSELSDQHTHTWLVCIVTANACMFSTLAICGK